MDKGELKKSGAQVGFKLGFLEFIRLYAIHTAFKSLNLPYPPWLVI